MTKTASWIVSIVVAVITVGFLLWVASYRFAVPLVDPAPPPPDYPLQGAIAYAGCGVVLVTFILTRILASRSEHGRGGIVVIGSVSMLVFGGLSVLLAFLLSA